MRVPVPFMRFCSWPNHLPRSTPPNTITLGLRFSTYELGGGDTNIQSITRNNQNPVLWNLSLKVTLISVILALSSHQHELVSPRNMLCTSLIQQIFTVHLTCRHCESGGNKIDEVYGLDYIYLSLLGLLKCISLVGIRSICIYNKRKWLRLGVVI